MVASKKVIDISGKIIIITDPHGNYPTLKKALDFSHEAGVFQLISLGDLVDYNAYENKVLETILNYDQLLVALRGNHDKGLEWLYRSENIPFVKKRGLDKNLARQAMNLPDQAIIQLKSGVKILLCHSNPDNNHYVYLDPQYKEFINEYLLKLPYTGFWYGHTHLSLFYENYGKHAFNPGSIGDSRTGDPVMTFAWIDSENGEISLFGISVDEQDQTKVKGEVKLIKKLLIK